MSLTRVTEGRNFILDLDGTLVDSFQDIYDALVAVAKDSGLPKPSRDDVRNQMHLRLDQLLDEIFPEIEGSEAIGRFRQHYDGSGYPNTRPYPGVCKTIESMYQKGYRLFVATNKRGVAACELVRRFDICGYIEKVVASDCSNPPLTKDELVRRLIVENGLDPQRTIMVGDTQSDLDAARKNGISFVFVSYGYGKMVNDDGPSISLRVIEEFTELDRSDL